MSKIESENNNTSVDKNGNAWENVIDIEEDTKKSAVEVVDISRRAFATGKSKSLEFRKDQLKQLLTFLQKEKNKIIEALHKDLRKHKLETEIYEIEIVANDIRHSLIELKNWAKPSKPEKRLINILDGVYIYKEPYGVVLIIGAWNYPILLTLGPVLHAISAGNTIVLKPSEIAPHTATLLATVLTKYLDKECFQVYLGAVQETTELLDQKFDYIFFTGSTAVGRIIYKAAAKNLTPVTLELGGKSPVYLDDNVDMERAARRIIWGKIVNSGQTCIAPDYLLCTKATEKKFLREAQKILTEFYGSDPKRSTYISKIVTDMHFKRLLDFIKTENVAIGGKFIEDERLLAPTILINVNPDDSVMREEIFGPILPIINIKDVEEAIEFINAREKPLSLYVFTKDKNIRKTILERTSSGGVTINDTITHVITENLPFGGVGGSGMGSYHGQEGFDTFSHKKSVLIKDFSGFSELGLSMRYPPYNDAKVTLLNCILKKRKSIPNYVLKNAGLFSAGFIFSYFFQYVSCLINGCE
ncbi:aldehyde dehydrogenase, dimeric NADP-preferring-like [Diorhabda sublineata]|uniref:aldehyde dehydrogenase, dimeric NADP-preferring-like n=1 Tax=Diorhabda sublineata TaxID=1163346 RepID=UPI0024E09126|nr:aldehyde dehydrogenase, dimeric NADP-preferring-like [Diorhabda sublineata]